MIDQSFIDDIADAGLGWAAVVLLAALMLVFELGWRAARRQVARGRSSTADVGVLVAGTLGLLAFVLGFSISLADDRFESRRQLVVKEANAIGSAWLRAGVAGGEEGARIQAQLVEYARLRLAFVVGNRGEVRAADIGRRTIVLQTEIWAVASGVAQRSPTPISAALMIGLNEAFDAATEQHHAYMNRVPAQILSMLVLGSLIAAGTLGYQVGAGGTRHSVLGLGLMVLWTGAIMIVVDLNRPRDGLVRADPAPLHWTLQGMGERP